MHDIEIFSEVWGGCDHDKQVNGYNLIEINAQKHAGIKKVENQEASLFRSNYSYNYSFTLKNSFLQI